MNGGWRELSSAMHYQKNIVQPDRQTGFRVDQLISFIAKKETIEHRNLKQQCEVDCTMHVPGKQYK